MLPPTLRQRRFWENRYSWGAALHEIQDWYSHRNESYGRWSYGHGVHSALAGCSAGLFGDCRRSASMTDFFYSVVGTEPRIRQELGLQYGPSSVAWVSLFFAAIDPCSITSTLAREAIDPPSQWDVWWFLASRRFSP